MKHLYSSKHLQVKTVRNPGVRNNHFVSSWIKSLRSDNKIVYSYIQTRRGALEGNLTGRCPIFKNFHNPFRGKNGISIPCLGIFRLQNNRENNSLLFFETIAKQEPIVFEQIVITRFRISDQFSHPVQDNMLKNDTLKMAHLV